MIFGWLTVYWGDESFRSALAEIPPPAHRSGVSTYPIGNFRIPADPGILDDTCGPGGAFSRFSAGPAHRKADIGCLGTFSQPEKANLDSYSRRDATWASAVM